MSVNSVGDDALLEVTDVVTQFLTPRGIVHAVDGVSFRLGRGRSMGIVGESGSGKTILSRSIMGLLPRRNVIHSGSIVFEGEELATLSPRERRQIWGRDLAMIFQDPMTSLNPVMTVGAQIAEPLRIHRGYSRAQAKARAVELLREVQVPEPARRVRQYPHELSGGMRQRIMIAIAMSCGPKLLIADEPTTALDVTVQAQVLEVLREQRLTSDASLILITHDLGVVANHTDQIVVMYAGQIVEAAPTRELFDSMMMPYTAALMASIPRMDQPSQKRLYAIEGRPPDSVNPPTGCRFAARCEFAQDRCLQEPPPLVASTDNPEHLYRCWFPLTSDQHPARSSAATVSGHATQPQDRMEV